MVSKNDVLYVQLELVEASRKRYQKAALGGSQKLEAVLEVRSSSSRMLEISGTSLHVPG